MALGSSFAGSAKVVLTADTGQFDRGMREAQGRFHSTVNTIEHDTSRMSRGILAGSGAFSHLGRSIAFASGAFLGAAGFTSLVRGSVKAAEELQTQMTRTGQVFGKSGEEIRQWSETTNRSLHLASGEALLAANNTGAFLKSMGVAPQVASKYSEQLVKLGNELSRLRGIPLEDAMKAIDQGLVGRGRALAQLGIHIDATAIKQRALADGLVKGVPVTQTVTLAEDRLSIARAKAADALAKYGSNTTQYHSAADHVVTAQNAVNKATAGAALPLTNAQKAFVSYQIIMEQSGKTSESYTKWTHSLAGEQVALHANIKQVEEGLGTALIPTLLKLITPLNAWLGNTKNQKTLQHDFQAVLKTVLAVIKDLIPFVKVARDVFDGFAKAVGGGKNAVELLAGAFVAAKLVGGFDGLSRAAGEKGAAGSVKLLSGRLGSLAKFAAAGIAIDVAINFIKGNRYDSQDTWSVGGILHALNPANFGKDISAALGGKAPPDSFMSGGGGGTTAAGVAAITGQASAVQRGIVGTAAKLMEGPYAQYLWGGGHAATPGPTTGKGHGSVTLTGFDCSGFVRYVMAQNGITVPGTSQAQAAGGVPVPPGELAPGDLVFSEGWPHPGHVGIYVGSGLVIEDPHTGASIRYTSVASFGVQGARRYYSAKDKAFKAPSAGKPPAAASTYATNIPSLVVGTAKTKAKSSLNLPSDVSGSFPATQGLFAAFGRIPGRFGEAIAAAGTTRGAQDNLRAYDDAIRYVEGEIKLTDKSWASRTKLEKLLASLADKRNKILAPIMEAAITKATPKAPDVSEIDVAINNLQAGFGTKQVTIPGIGKLLTQVSFTPTVGAWKKLLAQLKKKYTAAAARVKALQRSLATAKRARFPNKSLIGWLQGQVKAAQKLAGDIKADVVTCTNEITQLKADAVAKEQKLAQEEDTAAESAATSTLGLDQQAADAALSGQLGQQLSALQAQDAFLANELATGTVRTADGRTIPLTAEARVAVTNALAGVRASEAQLQQQIADAGAGSGATVSAPTVSATQLPIDLQIALARATGTKGTSADDIAAYQAQKSFLEAGLAASTSPEDTLSFLEQLNSVNNSLDTLIADQNAQTTKVVDAIAQQTDFLTGLRTLRGYENTVLGGYLGGASITIINQNQTMPDAMTFSEALKFELSAIGG